MSKDNKRELKLDVVQEKTLTEMRDHHPKPYLREKAGALLKIAAGKSVRWVAHQGLLKRRNYKTVMRWLDAYEEAGLGGLYVASGRGRKPAYHP